MYAALALAPVSLVAPVVATYPLVTALASAAVLRDEPLTARMLAGATLIVAAIVCLVVAEGPVHAVLDRCVASQKGQVLGAAREIIGVRFQFRPGAMRRPESPVHGPHEFGI